MATKKFIIEVEEGRVECENCPFDGCKCSHEPINTLDCNKYNLTTMKITEHNKGEDHLYTDHLYAVNKTAERNKEEDVP